MAAGTDPLQRDRLGIVSQDPGDRLIAPKAPALQLAQALGDLSPEVANIGAAIGQEQKRKAEANAHRDAVIAAGVKLGDAVRAGKIQPTQNPFYIQAYNRESAAIRAQTALRNLQTQSTTWAEKSDAAAFEKRWREEVGKLGEGYTAGDDEAAGFVAAEDQFTPQVLQSNQAQNVTRITTERTQNLSALAANALSEATKRNGGTITASQLVQVLAPAKAQWLQTGGTEEAWNGIALQAIVTAAEATQNPGLLDAAKGLGLDGKPSAGDNAEFGSGAANSPDTPLPRALPPLVLSAGKPGGAIPPPPPTPRGTVLSGLPIHGTVTGHFGDQRPGHKHNGIDIDGRMGDPIRPRAGGTVKVGHNAASGNYVVINHGGGVETSYAHMQRVDVKNGDRIAAGTPIGTVGNTGNVRSASGGDGSHLHYVVRVKGVAVDPARFNWRDHPETGPSNADTQPVQQQASTTGAPIVGPSGQPTNPDAITRGEAAPRGPSLYDMTGVAQDIEMARYRISDSVQSQAVDRVRQIQATRTLEGISVANAVYAKYGASVLTGNYDLNGLVKELTAAGYTTQAIGEGLSQIRAAVGDSAGLVQARHTLNSSDGGEAQRIFSLAAEGRKNGWSQGYEDRVGREVLSGAITSEDAVSMISGAHSRTDFLESQAHQAEAEARAETRWREQLHRETQPVHNWSELRDQAATFADFAIVTAKNRLHIQFKIEDDTRKYLRTQITQQMNSWLVAHPGDWDGAVAAGNNWTESYLRRNGQAAIQQIQSRHRPGGNAPAQATSAGNPRR